MEDIIKEIYQGVVKGNALQVKSKIETALQSGIDAEVILSQGLIEAMREVGRLFEIHEYFVPDMLISARAMQAGVVLLQPSMVEQGVKPIGKVVLGTVKGDLHNIGLSLIHI
jgi:5-methyltetrahydrofolate--homocysteine methyltransferase